MFKIRFFIKQQTCLEILTCDNCASLSEPEQQEKKKTVTMTTWVWIYAVRRGSKGCHGCTMSDFPRKDSLEFRLCDNFCERSRLDLKIKMKL